MSFHNRKNVRKCTVEKRDKAIIKALEKTKEWKEIDLKGAQGVCKNPHIQMLSLFQLHVRKGTKRK